MPTFNVPFGKSASGTSKFILIPENVVSGKRVEIRVETDSFAGDGFVQYWSQTFLEENLKRQKQPIAAIDLKISLTSLSIVK